MKRTYPNLSRVTDPETRETVRIIYDLIYKVADDGEAAREDLSTALATLEDLVPEVEGLSGPSLFASAGGLGPGHYVAADVQDQQVMVVSVNSPSRVLFRHLEVADLHNVFHETPYADGDFLIYDKAKEQWRGKAVAGVVDHGGLLGLGDDDHVHYALADKSRPVPWVAAADLAGLSIADLGTKDHDLLDGLLDDDHTIYALLAGRAGGQTLYGGTADGEDLYLYSTAHANKGTVFLGDIGGVTIGGNLNMNLRDILAVDDIVGSGGSRISGGSGAGESLILQSTTHATKAKIYLGASLNDYYDEAIEELYINTAKAAGIGAEVGDAFIGTHAGGANVAIFCNEALKAVANAQALSVSAAGGITMQCAVGQGFNIQSGVNVILQLGTPEIGVWKSFSMNSNDILGVDDIVGNSGSKVHGGSVAGTYLVLSSTSHATKGYIWFGSTPGMVFTETDGGTRLRLEDSDTCILKVETTGANKAAHLTLMNSNVGNAQQWDILNDGSAADVFAIKDNTALTTPVVIEKAAPNNMLILHAAGTLTFGGVAFDPANWTDLTDAGATILHKHDHGNMDGLTDDDHTRYLDGRGDRCRIYEVGGPQTFATGVWAPITFDSERYDPSGMHNPAVNPSRITIATAGTYLIGGNIRWAASAVAAAERRGLAITVNGIPGVGTEIARQMMHTSTMSSMSIQVTTMYDLAAADFVELCGWQNSGGNLDAVIQANFAPEFWVQRVE